MVLVYSVVRRHMKKTSGHAFTVFDGVGPLPVELSLHPEEVVVGWYRNPPPWERYWIVFTSEAIYLVDEGQVDRIAVEDIVGYESPESKQDVTGVRVLTKDGFRFVRIAGCFGPNGNQRDAYSFIMVIRALVPGTPVISFQNETSGKN
jgi:hypothetical protein